MITLGASQSGESEGKGSGSVTSRAAPDRPREAGGEDEVVCCSGDELAFAVAVVVVVAAATAALASAACALAV